MGMWRVAVVLLRRPAQLPGGGAGLRTAQGQVMWVVALARPLRLRVLCVCVSTRQERV